MTVLFFVVVVFLFVSLAVGAVLYEWFNKNVLGFIWHEEDRTVTSREVYERIQELCVDGEVPTEAELLLVAQEHGLTEKQLYAAFNASGPAELTCKFTKKRDVGTIIAKTMVGLGNSLKHPGQTGMRR